MEHSTKGHGSAAAPPRWAVWAAYAVPLCVLPSAIWRAGAVFDGTISMADGAWYLLLLSGLSMALALLTLAPLCSGMLAWGPLVLAVTANYWRRRTRPAATSRARRPREMCCAR